MSAPAPFSDRSLEQSESDDAFVDVGDYRTRQVNGVMRPRSVGAVVDLVKQAAAAHPPQVLQPISTGFNWGLGSRKPAEDGSSVVDLSGLAALRELNLEYGYAIIEPGFSQRQLSCALAGTAWYFNVTGSTEESSIIGNLLERGQGYKRSRVEDLIGLEVVLPTGEVVHLGGFWERRAAGGAAFHYRQGMGPDLAGLFLQSNLGIVTAAVVALLPRPETMRMLRCTMSGERLAAAVDAMQKLYAEGLLNAVGKALYGEPSAQFKKDAEYGQALTRRDFILYSAYSGRKAVADVVEREIRTLLEASGAVSDIQLFDVADAASMSKNDLVMAKLFLGQLDGDGIKEIFGIGADRFDRDARQGWLFFFPVLPFRGCDADAAVNLFLETVAEQRITGNMTLNFISASTIDIVISLDFPRSAEGIARGHQTLERLHDVFIARGYLPYRFDIDRAKKYRTLADPEYQALVNRLRGAVDPGGVMARGRYL